MPPDHTLTEEESKHCVRVLRLGMGDTLHLTDGRGRLFRCTVTDDHPKHCTVRVAETFEEWERLPYRLTMAVAPTKNADRYEWFLEKATEVGVEAFVPLETAHSERRVFKPERAEKVITAAMKQSLKAYRPTLRPLATLRAFVEEPFEGRRLIAHCDEARTPAGKRYLISRAAARRGGAGADRSRGGFLARGDRLRAGARIRGDHARHAAAPHRDGRRSGRRDGRREKRRGAVGRDAAGRAGRSSTAAAVLRR